MPNPWLGPRSTVWGFEMSLRSRSFVLAAVAVLVSPPAVAFAAVEFEPRVGETIELAGMSDGERMAVTVVQVVDPAQVGEFFEPSQGQRYVAVQFKLENTGTAAYDDAPSNGAYVVDTSGQSFRATIADTSAGPGFPGSVSIGPGDTGLGFITFEVPLDSQVAKVQFALNSGFADEKGEWQVI